MRLIDSNLTHNTLTQALHYDPVTGAFMRYLKGGRLKQAGSVQGADNHIAILVSRQNYTAHTLAWFYVHKEKRDDVYHLNGNKQDNRLTNLACYKK